MIRRLLALGAACLVLAALTGPPAAASPPARPPLALGISPFHLAAPYGVHELSGRVLVSNLSRYPLRVASSFAELRMRAGTCHAYRGPSWARVYPAAFTLAPRKHLRATVRVSAPGSARGLYALAAVFTGRKLLRVPGATGLRIRGAIGERVTITLPGRSVTHPCPVPGDAASPRPSSGLPWWLPLVAALGGLSLGLAAWGLVLRRRRGVAHGT